MDEKGFDNLKAEKHEIDMLIERGMKFTTPKRSFLRWFSKNKERTWYIQQPYLGTLDILASVFIDMQLDEKAIQENPLAESKKIVAATARLCARAIAVAVLNDRLWIRLLAGILARYFLWHIQPTKMLQLSILINQMSNYADFINSIRLMSSSRTTAPKENRIEEPEASEALTAAEARS